MTRGMHFTGLGVLVVIAALLGAGAPVGSQVPGPDQPENGTAAAAATEAAAEPGRCSQLLEELLGTRAGTEVVIALVPDPIDSSLDWAFDSHLEAIRNAFEDSGYVMERMWLPWFDGTGALRSRSADETTPLWMSEPGFMLFRSAGALGNGGFLLLVVGETPTGGVHRVALETALDELRVDVEITSHSGGISSPLTSFRSHRNMLDMPRSRALSEVRDFPLGAEAISTSTLRYVQEPERIAIIGPTFSGSSGSLRSSLDRWSARQNRDYRFRIISGTATSLSNQDTLSSDTMEFSATIRPDPDLARLLTRLTTRAGGHPDIVVATLQEGSTGYGQAGPAHSASQISIPFSMHISGLRTAFADSPWEEKESEQSLLPAREARVRLNLRGRRNSGAQVATSELTPPVLDLQLDQMVAMLRGRQAQLVGVIATDVRDKIFLATEIRSRLRDVRLFSYESNLLFLAPEINPALTGMLVFSTYPLAPTSRLWTPAGRADRFRSFTCDTAQGVYNATVLQLDRPELLIEYAPPSRREQVELRGKPAVWLSVVGRRALIPLWVEVPPQRLPPYLTSVHQVPAAPSVGEEPRPELAIGIVLLAFSAACAVLWLAWVYLRERVQRYRHARREEIPYWPSFDRTQTILYREVERVSVALHGEIYAAAFFLTLFFFLLPLHLVDKDPIRPAVFPMSLPFLIDLSLLVTLVTVLVATGHALAITLRNAGPGLRFAWKPADLDGEQRLLWWIEIVSRCGVVVVSLLFATYYGGYLIEVKQLGHGHSLVETLRMLYYNRLLQVNSGLSPLVPVVLIGLVLAVGFFWERRRVRFLARTDLFAQALRHSPQGSAFTEMERPVTSLRHRLFRFVPDRVGLLLMVVLSTAVGALWHHFDWSLETLVLVGGAGGLSDFDRYLRLGVLVGVVAVPWNLYRFLSTWMNLCHVLAGIGETGLAAVLKVLSMPERLTDPTGFSPENRHARRELDSVIHEATRHVVEELQKEQWEGRVEEPLRSSPGEATDPEAEAKRLSWCLENLGTAGADDGSGGGLTVFARLAGLHAAWHIQRIVGHLWRFALVILVSAVLVTILISSYPFWPQGLVKLVYTPVLALSIVVFVVALAQAERNAVLSRIRGEEPGKLKWSWSFLFRLGVFGLVPVLTLIGTEVPLAQDGFITLIQSVLDLLTRGVG